MLNILKFYNIQYFPVWVAAMFYLPQSIIGMGFFDGFYSLKVFVMLVASCSAYLFFYFIVFSNNSFQWVGKVKKLNVGVLFFPLSILVIYMGVTIYAAVTIDQIALVAVFRGASIDELSRSRGDFLGNRTGWEAILPYLYTILKMALMPYAVAALFFAKHKFRFYFLVIFLITLSLTLEKSLALVALIPLIILAANSTKKIISIKKLLAFLALFIVFISFLSRGGLDAAGNSSDFDDGGAASIPVEYQLIKSNTQISYLANRVIWIPFATAIDWLKYQDQVLDGKYSLGASIGLVAGVIGVEKANFEKEVFRFQWGQNENETGTSNTAYFIDAFVNFSWFGIILYAGILALIVRIIAASDNIPAKSAVYVGLFYLSFNSLPPILFSGGLVFLIFIVLFIKPVKQGVIIKSHRRAT